MNEVKANEPILRSLEAETKVEKSLEEPKDEFPLVDDVLSLNQEGTKCFGTKNSLLEAQFGLRTGSGVTAPFIQGKDDLNLGALDGILDDIDEVEYLDFTNGLSGSCEDYFLDIDLAQEVSALGRGPCDGLHFGNSSSDSHSPGYSCCSNCVVGTSETSTLTTTPYMKCKDNSCKRTGRCVRSLDLGMIKLENDVDCLVSSPLDEDEKVVAEESRAAENTRVTRKRKPPLRYIDESWKENSQPGNKHANAVSKDKPPLWKQPNKKYTTLVEPEPGEVDITSESDSDFSKKKPMKSMDRRKHQRMWTVQEVTKLVDGISEFGAGHWTDIKRLSFASTAYRTPIDLRDKWRNLLRACHAQKPEKRETDQKSGGRPIPKSLLHRVRELAAIHPYPRKTKTRSSFFLKNS